MRLLALLLAAMLLLAACGDDGAEAPLPEGAPEDEADDPAAGTQLNDAELTSLTGMLRANGELEGGCAWIETDGGQYDIDWPEGYTVDFAADPITLTGPDGETVATIGDQLTVEGAVNPDVMTICQVGPVFEATSVQVDDSAEL
jgi:hypothetical protein